MLTQVGRKVAQVLESLGRSAESIQEAEVRSFSVIANNIINADPVPFSLFLPLTTLSLLRWGGFARRAATWGFREEAISLKSSTSLAMGNGESLITKQKQNWEWWKLSGVIQILALIDSTTWHWEQLIGTMINGALTQVRYNVILWLENLSTRADRIGHWSWHWEVEDHCCITAVRTWPQQQSTGVDNIILYQICLQMKYPW